jgi:hypothetical protein
VEEFAAARANSLLEEARGGQEEATRGLCQAGGSTEEPHAARSRLKVN